VYLISLSGGKNFFFFFFGLSGLVVVDPLVGERVPRAHEPDAVADRRGILHVKVMGIRSASPGGRRRIGN